MNSPKAILNLDVYKSSTLKEGENAADIDSSFEEYNQRLAKTCESFHASKYDRSGDGVIYIFPTPGFAINAALSLANELADFNERGNKLRRAFITRIGITTTEMPDIDEQRRGRIYHADLDLSGHLEDACPPGRVMISRSAYDHAGQYRSNFRTGPRIKHGSGLIDTFVLKSRHLTAKERNLVQGLSDAQREVLPAIPFPDWENLKPDEGADLTQIQSFLESDLVVVLGETRKPAEHNSGVFNGAASSDAVAVVELLCENRRHKSVLVGIDEWEDTQDTAASRNIIVVGSGIVNTYAYCFNDLIKPLNFARSPQSVPNVMDMITTGDSRLTFGDHGTHSDDRHSGLLVTCKNPFNVEKSMLWIAGITGMGTSCAARLALDFLRNGRNTVPQGSRCLSPIACVVSRKPQPNLPETRYGGRWRIRDYRLVWMTDRDLHQWHP